MAPEQNKHKIQKYKNKIASAVDLNKLIYYKKKLNYYLGGNGAIDILPMPNIEYGILNYDKNVSPNDGASSQLVYQKLTIPNNVPYYEHYRAV